MSKGLRFFAVITLILTLASCQSSQKKSHTTDVKPVKPTAERSNEKGLTEAHAMHRSASVSNVSYDIDIDLLDSKPTLPKNYENEFTHFNGKLVLEFEMQEPKDLTLDFADGEFKEVILNGTKLGSGNYNRIFFKLPAQNLVKGKNQLIAVYRQTYTSNGSGLYKFFDKEDGNAYLYTQFEPFDANQMFPCFDQPDIKATYKLKVRAPKDWSVITSTLESGVTDHGASKIWQFPTSAKFSTYVFSLHAGPYAVWKSSHPGKAGSIPLRVFSRQTLAKYVKPNMWFDFTKQGFKFFEDYFAYPYPYKKYDQVIAPNFNFGAMENVAAVTFSERYLVRGKITFEDEENLAETLLHEMAHMWFGDLVTMKWWNDLWLNESFASYLSYKAMASLPKFKHSWQSFFLGFKKWAYWNDQLITTHPIETNVPSTEDAFTNFDGITYGKGASVLKQINYLLGEQAFKTGIQNYFKNYAHSNTRRADFINSLAVAANTDLHMWTSEWLHTSGANTIEARFTCTENKISQFELFQLVPNDHPHIRTHQLEVALFNISKNTKKVAISSTAKVKLSRAQEPVKEFIGKPCPDLVYPNYNDYAFVRVKLDPNTLAKLPNTLSKIDDVLARTMFWYNLWEMTYFAELSLQDYTQISIQNLKTERNLQILISIMSNLSKNYASVQSYLPSEMKDAEKRMGLVTLIEKALLEKLQTTKPGSDEQKHTFNAYVSGAESTSAQAYLVDLLAGKKKVSGLQIDQDMRWKMIFQLATVGNQQADTFIETEGKKDTSDWGNKSKASALAAIPNVQNKQKYFKEILMSNSTTSLADTKAIIGGIFPTSQRHLKTQFAKEYFNALPEIVKTRDAYFIESFAPSLAPLDCTARNRSDVQRFLNSNPNLGIAAQKSLKVSVQEDERCEKIQDLFMKYTTSAVPSP